MILKKLTIQGYGPFYTSISIDIDKEVTVLTGQNDVGKSAVLRLIELICRGNNVVEADVNADRIYDATTPWTEDKGIYCKATFILPDNYPYFLPATECRPGDEVDIMVQITRGKRNILEARRNGQEIGYSNNNISRMPLVLSLPLKNEVSSVIDSSSANETEQDFLTLAFGDNSVQKLSALSDFVLLRTIRAANDQINEKLSRLLPYSLGLKLVIERSSREPLTFSVGFKDRHGGDTPIHYRGSGVRKIVSLMVALMRVDPSQQLFILFDEPENSLHADAQHLLRALLEQLATNERFQVIYATHSASMINPINCKGLTFIRTG